MDDSHKDTVVLTSASDIGRLRPSNGQACIILLHPPGPDLGSQIALSNGRYQIGREPSFEIVIGRESVSRRHAELVLQRDRWRVVDLGSTNGTFVNDERVTDTELVDGDQIRFGDAIFKFLSGENVEGDYHEEIFKMTIMDSLTGLHNKRHLLDFIARELSVARRFESPLSLVLFDIDDFKRVNDEWGHLCGDAVLKQLASRLRPRIRKVDLIARYGGDEFAIVLVQTDQRGSVNFAEHVRSLTSDVPFLFEGDSFRVTVSVGVSTVHREPDVTVDDIISSADANLYRAKERGRNQVVPSMADLVEI